MSGAPQSRAPTLLGAVILVLVGVLPASGAPGEKVVASGLDNPRGLAFSPDGALYVAESGTGGSGPCFVGPEGPSCFGYLGRGHPGGSQGANGLFIMKRG